MNSAKEINRNTAMLGYRIKSARNYKDKHIITTILVAIHWLLIVVHALQMLFFFLSNLYTDSGLKLTTPRSGVACSTH